MRGRKGRRGQGVGRQGAAGVEPEPPEPQQPRPQDGHGQVVRNEGGVVAVTLALAHHQGRGQGRDAGVDVDDRAPGEIQGPQAFEPAAVTQTQWATGR